MHSYSPTSIAERVILMDGWRAALLAVFAGALSALSLAPFHLFPILFFTIPVLVWLLDGAVAPVGVSALRRFWPAFRTGWLFGFGYLLAGLWWIGNAFFVDADEFLWALPLAVVGLPAGLAIFWGIGGALSRLVWLNGWGRLIGFAAAFTLTEFARGNVLTGFPWNLPGYAFMPNATMMQSSSLIGTYGMTFVTLLCASALAIFAPAEGGKPRRVRLVMCGALALFATHLGFGIYVMSKAEDRIVPGVQLRLVQPNIDQREKWKTGNAGNVLKTHLELSETNTGPRTSGPGAFTHIIWPESAFPFIVAEQKQALSVIAQMLPARTRLITGAMRREPPAEGRRAKVFNSALVMNGDGQIIAARDKTQLVPFGEFLPFQQTLESIGLQQLTKLQGGFSAGHSRQNISIPGSPPFLPLICYEVVYPGGIQAGGSRPHWLVNLTNDSWFGTSTGPYQHAHQTLVRAAEEGLPIVRVANSGISFVADPYGRVKERLPLGIKAVLDSRLPAARPPTLFARTGNLPVMVLICMIFLVLVGIRAVNTKRLQ